MKNEQNSNNNASIAFNAGKYLSAFDLVWATRSHKFVFYAEKDANRTDWFSSKQWSKFLWDKIANDDNIFNEIFKSDSAEYLLHIYYCKSKSSNFPLENRLAKEYPEVLIRAIRVNQVFLKPEKFKVIKDLPFDSKYSLHKRIWNNLHEIEQSLWKKIESNWNDISENKLSDILSYAIVWIETERSKNNTNEKIQQLSNVYNFFISYLSSKHIDNDEVVSDSKLFRINFERIFWSLSRDKEWAANPIAKLLSNISQWTIFRDNILSAYCFDLSIEPKQSDETVSFNSTPEAHYRWKLDGVRYEANQACYFINALEKTMELSRLGKIGIPGVDDEHIYLNTILASQKRATRKILEDLCIDTINVAKDKSIKADELLNPIATFAFNKTVRYERELMRFRDWNEAMIKLIKDPNFEPFIFLSKSDYTFLNLINGSSEKITQSIIELFGFEPNKDVKFNRFNLQYDVWNKPFIVLGNHIFCPTIFFGKNMWFYAFTQVAMLSNNGKNRNETREMEDYLGKLIGDNGYKVTIIGDSQANNMKGDVDIVVEDMETVLLIQLKRTKFRLDLKSAYDESMKSDKKAAEQLAEAEKWLLSPNEICNTLGRKVIKWIVSTSFEGIADTFGGCKKINYFELIHSLPYSNEVSLGSFISNMEFDRYLTLFLSQVNEENAPDYMRELLSEILYSLDVFASEKYVQSLFSSDEAKSLAFRNLYNEALDAAKSNQNKEALNLFQEALKLCPNDGDAHGALANVLADMRQFDKALSEFNIALQLLPNDPWISRNYFIALLQSGKTDKAYQALSLSVDLYEKYPLLGDFYDLMMRHICQIALLQHLTIGQLAELKERVEQHQLL